MPGSKPSDESTVAARTVPLDPPTARLEPPTAPPTARLEPPTAPMTAYRRGVAPVQPRAAAAPPVEPTPVSAPWPGAVHAPRPPLRYQVRELANGWEWSGLGGLFAFVCWGVWAISERGEGFVVPVLTFALVLLVAAGVFALARLLGRMLLERWLGRPRRSAWPSHLATGVFLAAVGVEYLRRTQWIVDAFTWLRGLA